MEYNIIDVAQEVERFDRLRCTLRQHLPTTSWSIASFVVGLMFLPDLVDAIAPRDIKRTEHTLVRIPKLLICNCEGSRFPKRKVSAEIRNQFLQCRLESSIVVLGLNFDMDMEIVEVIRSCDRATIATRIWIFDPQYLCVV